MHNLGGSAGVFKSIVSDVEANRAPVPTRYVLVPCSVIGLGFRPSILITLDDNCSIDGIIDSDMTGF